MHHVGCEVISACVNASYSSFVGAWEPGSLYTFDYLVAKWVFFRLSC